MTKERNVREFNRDVINHDGYLYATDEKLSCRLSNGRMTAAILEAGDLAGKRVIDIGCGDGTYSIALLDAGAESVVGVDAAEAAIERANLKFSDRENLHFEVVDIYELEAPEEPYDAAVLRGILHHLYDAERAIERICRSATEIIVVEPNGFSPVLKVIEKVSPYHRKHEEKSYSPKRLDRWFESKGGQVEWSGYIGLVPMFCPDPLARMCKWLEPFVERTPVLNRVSCAQYIQKVRMG